MNSNTLALMYIELAKVNSESNIDIKNKELLNTSDVTIYTYRNSENSNDNDYIVVMYSDFLDTNSNETFCAQLFFNVSQYNVTHKLNNEYVRSRQLEVAYLYALNMH